MKIPFLMLASAFTMTQASSQTYLPATGGTFRTIYSRGEPHTYGVGFINSNASSPHTWMIGAGAYNKTYQGFSIYDETTGSFPLRIHDNSNITFEGKVGVGTATPGFLFHIEGVESSNWLTATSNTGTSGHSLYFGYNNNSNTTYGLYITGGRGLPNQLDFGVENKFYVMGDGKVGIGTSYPSEKLSVNGNVSAKKIIVTQTGWSDYVFNDDYALRPLSRLAQYIKQNKHLPDIPSEKEVNANGINIGDNQALLLKKVEELTLYVIHLQKQVNRQAEKITQLQHKKIVR